MRGLCCVFFPSFGMKIKELSQGERPREKLLERGAVALSDGELLAILLRTGRQGESVLAMAQNLLRRVDGSLLRLFGLSVEELIKQPGIGSDKACTIHAACELGRRFMLAGKTEEKKPVISARMIYDIMLPHLKGAGHEESWALFLNAARYVIGKEKLTSGSGDATTFDVRRIVKRAIDRGAFAVVLVHNHPSGNPQPSRADIDNTRFLHDACAQFDIILLDHVVLCDDCFFSFEENRTYRG